MMVPAHVKFRKSVKNFFDKFLRYVSQPAKESIIDKTTVKRILIVRINYRIGNILFITPLVKQLEKEFPDAKVDVLIGAKFTKDFFSNFKNVENIFYFERKQLKNPFSVISYILSFRIKKYDVVFNINGGSTSDRLATMLVNAKYKISFCNDDIYTPTNICVRHKDTEIEHEALKPLELLKAFDIKPDYKSILDISLSESEIKEGKERLLSLIKDFDRQKVFGIFRNARYEKKLDDEFWNSFVNEIKSQESDVVFVDVLSPDIEQKLQENMVGIYEKDLRKLAAVLANLDVFICGDTGPMHLASASGVPTVALFKMTAPKLYGTLKKNDLSLVIKDKSVKEIVSEITTHLADVKKSKIA